MGVTTTTAAANTYVPIATTTLGSAAASYTFTSVSTTYTDLVLIANYILTVATDIRIQVGNGSVDTGTNYSDTELYGTGSSAGSGRHTNLAGGLIGYGQASGIVITQLQNYSNTTTYKTFLSRNNDAGYEVDAVVALWRSTSAINTVKVLCTTGSFQTGSTFSLYGILAA